MKSIRILPLGSFNSILIWMGILGLCITMIWVGLAFKVSKNSSAVIDGIAKDAQEILARCKDEKDRPFCYDREIPKLMKSLSLEDTFKVIQIVQTTDQGYPYCHVLGHTLGGLETAKDPSKWQEVAGRCSTNMCSNGCMHGVFQERFRKENAADIPPDKIVTMLSGICGPREGWNPTHLVQGSCTHALGHLAMYLNNADTKKSLTLCENIAVHKDGYDLRPLCYDGVFMQLFQPLGPDDEFLVKGKVPTASQLDVFCAPYTGEEYNSCWSESWPLAITSLRESAENATTFCNKLERTGGRSACLHDIFYIMATQFNLDEARMLTYCAQGSDLVRNQCFAAVAARLIEVDSQNGSKAVHFCSMAETVAGGDACYESLARSASYDFGHNSDLLINMCTSLPVKWKALCMKEN